MDESPLSKLAPEIRNSIYGLVLTQPDPIELANTEGVLRRPHMRNLLAITETYRAIHDECTQMFYATNTFSLYIEPGQSDVSKMLEQRWNQIGPLNASALRHVVSELKPFTREDLGPSRPTLSPKILSTFNSLRGHPPNHHASLSYRMRFSFDFSESKYAQKLVLPIFELDIRSPYESWVEVFMSIETQTRTETNLNHMAVMWKIAEDLHECYLAIGEGDV